MRRTSQWASTPRIVLVALLIAVVAALLFAFLTAGGAFDAFNPTWEGTSDLRGDTGDTESQVLLSAEGYERLEANRTVVFMIAPTKKPTAADATRIRQFVSDGGTLVVADDFGPHGNAVLADVGAEARIDGALLRDELEYAAGPTLPIAGNVTTHRYTTDVEQLTLNHGSAVRPGGADVLVRSSPVAYLDRTATGNLTAGDEVGAHPVVTSEAVDNGTVLTVSDPSIFINTMLQEPDNRVFATAILDGHDSAAFDYAHRESRSSLAVALVLLRQTPLVQGVVIFLGTAGVFAAAGGRSLPVNRLAEWLNRVSPTVAIVFGVSDLQEESPAVNRSDDANDNNNDTALQQSNASDPGAGGDSMTGDLTESADGANNE